MTTHERVQKALRKFDFNKENGNQLNELIAYAYYLGRCEKSKELCDKARVIYDEQHKRAKQCRYHKMAEEIVGYMKFMYDGDYDQWIREFGNDNFSI